MAQRRMIWPAGSGLGALALCLIAIPALAQSPQTGAAAPLTAFGSGSREPIAIDADRLDVFDKDNRAVFSGNVVAVQGETTMKCTAMTVFYERQQDKAAASGQPATPAPAATPPAAGGAPNDSAIRRVECKGPVTVVSKEQTATGDTAVFDRVKNIVTLAGNASLSQGKNVTRGERLVYNLNTGIANVEGGRVRALFVPGEEGPATPGAPAASPAPRR